MEVSCRIDGVDARIVVVSLTGSLNAEGTDRVWAAASSLLGEQHPSLLVDMEGVGLMTSAGLGTLVRLHHRVHKLGGTIALFGVNERVRSVIEVVMLTKILNLSDTLDEARNRVSRSPSL